MEHVEIPSETSEYLGALKSVRCAKTLAWLLVWGALAVQVTCFVLAQFTTVFESPKPAPVLSSSSPSAAPAPAAAAATNPEAATQPQSAASSAVAVKPQSATRPAALAGATCAATLREAAVAWVLPFTKFAGPVAGLALAALLLGAVQISLTGRLGGAAGFSSAFVWSLLLLLLLVPWQQIFPAMGASGVLFNFHELHSAVTRAQSDWAAGKYSADVLWLFSRFLIYPFVVLIVWIIVGLRFAQGMKQVNQVTSVTPLVAENLSRPAGGK